jgi:hypothetical protein
LHSSPAPLAEPAILPLVPFVAGNALVAPLHALGIDLVLDREEAGVVVAVQGLLEVWDKGAALEKENVSSLSLIGSSSVDPYLVDVCSGVRSKLSQLVRGLAHVGSDGVGDLGGDVCWVGFVGDEVDDRVAPRWVQGVVDCNGAACGSSGDRAARANGLLQRFVSLRAAWKGGFNDNTHIGLLSTRAGIQQHLRHGIHIHQRLGRQQTRGRHLVLTSADGLGQVEEVVKVDPLAEREHLGSDL